ncbi:MAG: undecaprenyl diphosphate synthase family protein [Candidatus Woesearchaeota archaeon]
MFDFLKRKEESKTRYLHVAIDTKGTKTWCEKNKVSLEDGYLKSFSRIKELMQVQVEEKIPILSFLILPLGEKNPELLKALKDFVSSKELWEQITKHKLRITLLGKWYDLPSEVLEPLKSLASCTKDYDHFFLNFCINYDGQEEILDSFKIIARQLMAGKLSADNITKEIVKENLYSSYFIAPDLMIKNRDSKMDSFFLWDCVGARRIFTKKDFPEFDKDDFIKILKQ